MQASAPAPASFQYAYMAAICVASFDGATLKVKQGVRSFTVPLATLRQLYVQPTGAGAYLTLYLATEPAPGKKKIFRFYANAGQASFAALVDAVALRLPPGGDLRALPTREALKTMGALDLGLVVGLGTFAVIFLAAAIGLLPKLIHGLDFGQQEISAEALAKGGSLDSRNVRIVKAKALTGWTLAVTTVTKKSGIETGRSTSDFVPIVPKDWERGEPVRIVLQTNHDEDLALKSYRGIARTVMWEGLGSQQREWFEKKLHVKLADDVILVEHLAEPSTDLWTYVGINVGLLVIGAGVTALIVRKNRAKK